jgi:hypothetical protein
MSVDALGARPQQARHGPGLGRSHTAESGPRGVVNAALSRARVQLSEALVEERKQVVTAELVRRSHLVQRAHAAETCAGLVSSGPSEISSAVCTAALSDKKRFGCKCVRFGIPFSRDPRNPDVGKLLEQ